MRGEVGTARLSGLVTGWMAWPFATVGARDGAFSFGYVDFEGDAREMFDCFGRSSEHKAERP